ncbi:MAG: hypothetical protein WBA97_15875 [Actinophytocola sp.]|uniref:hypothetical protein n=1 Tax=Actinophytocola sp. TaxID=1872138 RepID=UPI003C754E3B
MNDLDQRLRYTLHELADTVPPSDNAKGDLERRLADRRGIRGPALVAAAAATVVAAVGVVIPLAVHHDAPAPPAAEEKNDGLVWSPDYDWVRADAGPHVLGTFARNGENVDAVAWVLDGQLCVAEGHHVGVGGSTTRPPAAIVNTSCFTVPAWPTGPRNSTHVETRAVLSDGAIESGPVPGLMLLLTDPKVEVLTVRSGDGSPVSVRELDRSGTLNLFLADFAGSTQGFGYTAYDADGNVVESAIT